MRLRGAAGAICVVLALAPVTALGQQASRGGAGASGSFSIEDVEPLLLRVAKLVDSGMTAADVQALADDIAKLPVGVQKEYRYTIKTKAGRSPLRIVVTIDDDDAADMTFSGSTDLTRRIDEAIGQYFEEMEE